MIKTKLAAASALVLASCCTPTAPTVLHLDGPDGEGSGVVIANGWILTAAHVLPVVTANGFPCGPAIVHPTLDLALVPCIVAADSGLEFGASPRTYDRLYSYGWHLGGYLLKTEGYQGRVTGTMSAAVIHGCSGGAVINARGELVGIVEAVAYITDESDVEHPLPHIAWYTPVDAAVLGWIIHSIP